MDELTLDNKTYLSSKRAAQVTGYAKDYVGQLCREGRVQARLVGRNWYVLESSILEHRFGAEEDTQTKQNAPAASPVSTWNPPVYSAENMPIVPSIAPKPIAEALPVTNPTNPVLADMQSAWQEWFQIQEKEEKMLPDASEMLLEAPETPIFQSEEEGKVQDDASPVHIERIQEKEAQEIVHIDRNNLYHEPVAVTKRYADVLTETPKSAYQRVAKTQQTKSSREKGARKGGRVFQAVLLSLAGLAVVVTVIGSGIADKFLDQGGVLSPISNFIGGVHTFNTR